MHVLITGAAGTIGRHLTKALESEHTLRLGDLGPVGDDPRFVSLDVTRPEQVQEAMQGIDAVIHLAIATGHEGEFEDDTFNQVRFDVNVKGTFNVLRAAQQAGVRRVVHTSSIMVVWGYDPPTWVESDAPARPVGTYATTKYLAEILCEGFARDHGLSIVCLRIAKPVDTAEPAIRRRRLRPQWVPVADLVQAYRCALTAEPIDFEIVTIVGESTRRRWDLSKAERVLGYSPTQRWEELGFELGAEREPYE